VLKAVAEKVKDEKEAKEKKEKEKKEKKEPHSTCQHFLCDWSPALSAIAIVALEALANNHRQQRRRQ